MAVPYNDMKWMRNKNILYQNLYVNEHVRSLLYKYYSSNSAFVISQNSGLQQDLLLGFTVLILATKAPAQSMAFLPCFTNMAECKDSVDMSSSSNSDKTADNMDKELKERHTGAAEASTDILVSRKRKQEKMDTEEGVKRPSFPPISARKLMVKLLNLLLYVKEWLRNYLW